VQLVGVADRDLAKAQSFGAPGFDSLDALLATRPDILDIILPPTGHAQAIRQALDAGLRAIICQKPFCTSLEEAREMTALAAAKGIPLIVHENFRFQPWYRAIKTAMDQGRIGPPCKPAFGCAPAMVRGRAPIWTANPISRKCPAS
jgi:predicted dehydrogenase